MTSTLNTLGSRWKVSGEDVEQARLGTTGLEVSRLCLGTMTFGLQSDEERSMQILDLAAESGVNFIDTADVYPARGPAGVTEEILGRWLKGKRDQFIVASKCAARVGPLPWEAGCSRKHILDAIDSSLFRLGTDYLDLYQLHFFDPDTPIDETFDALDHLVHSGKVRYVGCSNWSASQIALSLGRSQARDVVRFSSVQPRYNLLHRAPEEELFPLCIDQELGVFPYNPLAGGLLTAKYIRDRPPPANTRFGLSPVYRDLYWNEREFEMVEAVEQLARRTGLSVTTLSVAWVLAQPAVTSAIVGASRSDQLADVLRAESLTLDADTLAELDRITTPPGRSTI
jgi:aryl-alcohol dehydrogenase-like predicted oxidoreductase